MNAKPPKTQGANIAMSENKLNSDLYQLKNNRQMQNNERRFGQEFEYNNVNDEYDSDRETEQEAIALIKMQQNKINEYEEIIAESKCFEYQVEVYKQQISNLQSQVLVLEEKIRYSTFDSDNAKISELEARLLRAIEREKSMGTEINTKEQELKYLAERIEEK